MPAGRWPRSACTVRQLVRKVLALGAHDLWLDGIQTREILDEVLVVLVHRIELQRVLAYLIRNEPAVPAGHAS